MWPLSSHSHFKRRHFLTYLQTETRNTPPTQNQTTHTYTCFCRYGLPQRVVYHREISLPTTYIGSYGSESADTRRESGATPICSWLGDITSPTVLTLTHHNTRQRRHPATELQKRADRADQSVLFFLAGANFWEKHAKNRRKQAKTGENTRKQAKNRRFFVLIFMGEKLVGANFYAFCNYGPSLFVTLVL